MTQDLFKNHEDFPLEKLGISVIDEDEEVFFEEKPVQTEEVDNTGRKIGLVERYIREANRFSLLTPEEETTLAQTVKNGNREASEKARQKLITSNLRLVVKIARGFSKYWIRNLIDLIQEGNIGLMKAIGKFDPDRGIKLSYYSSFWIKAFILKFIMDNWRLVKIGTTQAQRKLFYNLKREKEKLLAEGFNVSPQLLADVMDVTEQEVMEMEQRLQGWDLSLEAPIRYDSGESHKDFLPDGTLSPEDLVTQADLLAWLRENLFDFREQISKREIFILDQRILSDSPLTLEEIGSSQGISRQRVEQIEKRLRKKFEKFVKEISPKPRKPSSRRLVHNPPQPEKPILKPEPAKGDTPMDKNLPEITRLIGYYLANKLQAKKINETSELFNLSSLQFEKLSFKPQTIRSIVSKMLEAGYFFSDGEEATRELLSRYPLGKKKLQKPDIPAPPGSAAADPTSAVSAAADPPADDPQFL